MAAEIRKVVEAHGASIEDEEELSDSYRLTIRAARGLLCTVDMDRDDVRLHGGQIFCTPWHIDYRLPDTQLGRRFPGDVNPHHRRKSTCFQDGIIAHLSHLHAVLSGAAEGWIFLDELTPEELAA